MSATNWFKQMFTCLMFDGIEKDQFISYRGLPKEIRLHKVVFKDADQSLRYLIHVYKLCPNQSEADQDNAGWPMLYEFSHMEPCHLQPAKEMAMKHTMESPTT